MESELGVERLVFYPFAYALLDDELSNYCWYCLGDDESLKKCAGCSVAQFCDKKCQGLGWKDHKVECKALKGLAGKLIPDVEVRLLGRIVTRYQTIESGKADKDPDFYLDRTSRRTIMQLASHTEDMRQDKLAWKKFESIYERLTMFYGEKGLADKDTVFELHCRDYINRHAISDKAYLKEIGKGLYLDLCAYDHSCAPNTIYSCNGFIATLRPLSSDVSIHDKTTTFYSYIDLLTSKQQRQKMLKETWYFDCQCKRCLDETEHILTSTICQSCKKPICIFGGHSSAQPQDITCSNCQTVCSKERVLEAVKTMRFINGLLERSELDLMSTVTARNFLSDLLTRYASVLSPVNVYYCRLIQAIIPRIDPADQEQLLRYHLDALECTKTCYPHNHPALAYHLMNMGIYCVNLNKKNEAIDYLTQSQNMLTFVLGKGHPMAYANQKQLDRANAL